MTGRRAATLAVLAVALLAAGGAAAQEAGIAVYGWGKADCNRFADVRRGGGALEQSLRQWVFGFASAYNILVAPSGDALKGATAAAVIDMVDRMCAQDPGLLISGAVNSIFAGD